MTVLFPRRAGLSTFLAAALLLPFAASAAATDDKVGAYSPTTGLRSPGISKAACSTYPSGRDINVTRKMYEIGQNRKISAKVMLAMFEAGWVESWLNNLNCGDRDSIGIFQMRPSMGWGTYEQLRDVTYQVNKFINVALPSRAGTPPRVSWRKPSNVPGIPTGTTRRRPPRRSTSTRQHARTAPS